MATELLFGLVGIMVGSLITYILIHKENDELKATIIDVERENEQLVKENTRLYKQIKSSNTHVNVPDFDEWHS